MRGAWIGESAWIMVLTLILLFGDRFYTHIISRFFTNTWATFLAGFVWGFGVVLFGVMWKFFVFFRWLFCWIPIVMVGWTPSGGPYTLFCTLIEILARLPLRFRQNHDSHAVAWVTACSFYCLCIWAWERYFANWLTGCFPPFLMIIFFCPICLRCVMGGAIGPNLLALRLESELESLNVS